MEDYMANLERKGLPFDSVARSKKGETVPLSGVSQSQSRPTGPTSAALGSPEYFDSLKKNAQFLSSSSMKKSKSGGGKLGNHGTKFEYLGSTPYSQGDASKSGSQKSASQSSLKTNAKGSGSGPAAKPFHNSQRKAVGTASTRKSNTTRNGRPKVVSSSDEDSSDELNIKRSSPPPSKLSSRGLIAIEVSGSDSGSEKVSWERKMHTGLKGARVPSPTRASRNLRPKLKARHDENNFSDETLGAKKTKVKPRPAIKGKAKADSMLTSLDSVAGSSSITKSKKGPKYSAPLSPGRISVTKQSEDTPRHSKAQKDQEKHRSNNKLIKGKAKASLAPFPMLPGSSSPEARTQSGRRPGNQRESVVESDDTDSEDDPLCSNNNDEIINRGGLRPFPMLSSPARSDSSHKPPSTSTMSSSTKRGSGSDDERGPAKRRRGSNGMLIFDPINEISFTQAVDRPDPKTLCPYCDMPFPENPSPLLLDMLKRIPKYRDVRPSNPLGLKAPLLSYLSMCQRHQFETQLYPTALKKGWPTSINFAELPGRVDGLRKHLTSVLRNKENSLFWGEIQKDIDIKGVRKAMGIAGQFSSFEKSQPGYYGEQGAVIISQILRSMFPLEDIDVDHIAPLTPADFIQRVLVPECALVLIQEDSGPGIAMEDALRTLRESSKYGTAMFPDLDNRDGISATEGFGGGQKIGEDIVKERVRARRIKIDEEERAEEELEKARAAEASERKRMAGKGGLSSISDTDHSPVLSQKEKTSKKAASKAKTRIGFKEEDVIIISDNPLKQTGTSSTSRTGSKEKSNSLKGANCKPTLSKFENLTLSRTTSQVAKTVKPRPRFAGARQAAKPDHVNLTSDEETDSKVTDETTPKPPTRVRANKPDSRSSTLTSKTTDYKISISNLKPKPSGSMLPLQAARARNTAKKETQILTNMRENNASDLDETDDSSIRSSSRNSRKRDQSSAWLLSDGSTPNNTPPF